MSGSRPHRQLMRVLLGDIVDGSAVPGRRLAPEPELTHLFGVGRGLVREAMRGLEDRGIVSVRQGHGTRVRPREDWNVLDEDVLSALLRSPLGVEVLGEFVELRRLVEVRAAGIAAERAGTEHLSALTNALVRMSAAAERAGHSPAAEDLWHEADVIEGHFHDYISSLGELVPASGLTQTDWKAADT